MDTLPKPAWQTIPSTAPATGFHGAVLCLDSMNVELEAIGYLVRNKHIIGRYSTDWNAISKISVKNTIP